MNLGFKAKLLMTSSILLTLSVGTANFISYSNEESTLKETIAESTMAIAKSESNEVQNYMDTIGRSVHGMALDYAQTSSNPDNEVSRLIGFSRASNIEIITVAYSDDRAYTNDLNVEGWLQGVAPESYRPTQSFWYKDAQQASGTLFTDVYIDTTTDTVMVSVAEKIPNGVIIADIPLKRLNEIVDSIDIEGAKAFILDQNSTVLASNHPVIKNTETLSEGTTFKELAKEITQSQTLISEYESEGKDKALFSRKIEIGDKHWYLAIELDKAIAFAKLDDAKYNAIVTTLVSLVVSLIIFNLLLNYIYQPIPKLKATIDGLSQGTIDLTQRLEVKGDDDLADIAKGVNQFVTNFQSMMRDIEAASIKMQNNMHQLRNRSAENASFLQTHLSETEQIVTAIEEMNSTAESVASDVAHTAQLTRQASETSFESRRTIMQSQDTVNALISDVTQSAENVQNMNTQTQNISNILNVIGEIAEQTNLLALNAAIEAARAGEYGRGFAVVADEVRNLASRTKESTAEVEQALDSLVNGSERVVESMDNTKLRCEETAKNAGEVANSLETMNDFVENINNLSTQIATATEQQSSVTKEVSQNMNAISIIVTDLEANGKKALEEAEHLNGINEQLVAIVQRFKI